MQLFSQLKVSYLIFNCGCALGTPALVLSLLHLTVESAPEKLLA